MEANAPKVSFVPAVNVTAPDEFVVPTNCLRTVNCVSLAPEFVAGTMSFSGIAGLDQEQPPCWEATLRNMTNESFTKETSVARSRH